MRLLRRAVAVCALVLVAVGGCRAADFSGRGSAIGEVRLFPGEIPGSGQYDHGLSLALEPDLYWRFARGELSFKPFVRLDSGDTEREHADIRELMWLHVGEKAEYRAGIGKVFWGVTESRHLVDVINQTDLVENIDAEDKLGQPMLWFSVPGDRDLLDLFVLPGFRERTFPGRDGRLRTHPLVDADQSVYESSDGDDHVDYAIRWSRYAGPFEFGVSLFDGTARAPRFEPGLDERGEPVLVPYYDQVTEAGLTFQAVADAWLFKLEAVRRDFDDRQDHTAAVGGFEYTRYSVFDSRIDTGFLAEYLYDSRSKPAEDPFDDDVFLGLRVAFNDVRDSELLAGVIVDRDNGSRLFSLEASRRIADHWRLTVEARVFSSAPPEDPLYDFRRDDYVEFTFGYYF
ncbi:MAG: hypothetical protein DWQ08_02350 [Proteobacteria bacterium]|nr:MAG: hypothetical protein DWQ08_02350 [Pseudomonadota bacterium]